MNAQSLAPMAAAIEAYASLYTPCPECNGHRGGYSDNGPAPRWVACDWCDGAGSFETEDCDV